MLLHEIGWQKLRHEENSADVLFAIGPSIFIFKKTFEKPVTDVSKTLFTSIDNAYFDEVKATINAESDI